MLNKYAIQKRIFFHLCFKPPKKKWGSANSLVINRHPFSRLVSYYHQKFHPKSVWKKTHRRMAESLVRLVEASMVSGEERRRVYLHTLGLEDDKNMKGLNGSIQILPQELLQ